ncbi:hypothetical protein ASD86_01495 [Lysobacter sp. Root690]|nr:hypothetical protein ASD86_01495 [Lysobacter sp. Root690]
MSAGLRSCPGRVDSLKPREEIFKSDRCSQEMVSSSSDNRLLQVALVICTGDEQMCFGLHQ